MPSSPLREFMQQTVALLVALIIVHASYVALVRPKAEMDLAVQITQQSAGDYAPKRSLWVVLKDVEQEACLVLMLWSFAIIAMKTGGVLRGRRLLGRELIALPAGTKLTPDDVPEHVQALKDLPAADREGPVARAIITGLNRFAVTGDVPAVAAAVHELLDAEGERLDAELSMLRYIVWAIPSIGFIGTVRGIGQALGEAHRAIEGDIAGVTSSLGVAFNSTFVALVVSIVVMFLMYQLQLLQERLVLDAHTYCDGELVTHLATSRAPGSP